MKTSYRLAVVLSHPIQYYSPWFRWISANTDLNLRVFYLSDVGLKPSHDEKFSKNFAWDIDLTSGYNWDIVPNVSPRPDTLRFNGLINPDLFPRLKAWAPDAILVFGYKYRTHLRLIAWAKLHGIPLIFRGDSHLIGRGSLSWKSAAALRLVYQQFAAITYVGSANRAYFQKAGVPEAKLFFAPHAVDQTRFEPDDERTKLDALSLRGHLRIPAEHRVMLFCAKMISSKQPVELLRAFIAASVENAHLILAGDGPERPELEALVQRAGARQISFLPFANQSEMPTRYAMADVFALPSRGVYETWGLAVNEAMHMRRPCLVSDHVGCQEDLVSDGKTGWVFPADNFEAFTACVRRALTVPKEALHEMSNAAQTRAGGYSYPNATRGLLAAIESIAK